MSWQSAFHLLVSCCTSCLKSTSSLIPLYIKVLYSSIFGQLQLFFRLLLEGNCTQNTKLLAVKELKASTPVLFHGVAHKVLSQNCKNTAFCVVQEQSPLGRDKESLELYDKLLVRYPLFPGQGDTKHNSVQIINARKPGYLTQSDHTSQSTEPVPKQEFLV